MYMIWITNFVMIWTYGFENQLLASHLISEITPFFMVSRNNYFMPTGRFDWIHEVKP